MKHVNPHSAGSDGANGSGKGFCISVLGCMDILMHEPYMYLTFIVKLKTLTLNISNTDNSLYCIKAPYSSKIDIFYPGKV